VRNRRGERETDERETGEDRGREREGEREGLREREKEKEREIERERERARASERAIEPCHLQRDVLQNKPNVSAKESYLLSLFCPNRQDSCADT